MRTVPNILLALSLAAILTACAALTTTDNSQSVEDSQAINSASASNSLVIYSGRADTLVQPIIERFAEQSGTDVEVRYGGTAELAGVLLEEGERSPADLFFAQDPGGLGAVQAAGMLMPLPEHILELVPERFASDSGEWVGTSGRARVVVYNTDAIADPATELPDDLWGFTDEQWNGRLGWAPSNGSFQAMITAMRSEWGDEKTAEWLQGIQDNNPQEYPKNTPIVAAVGAGEVDVGLVNHYYLYRFLSEEGSEFAARNYFLPGGGPGSLIMVSGVGVLNTSENAENALAFVQFLLSEDAQKYFAEQTYEYPVIEGLESSVEPPLGEIDEQAIGIPLTALADMQGTQDMLIDLGIIE